MIKANPLEKTLYDAMNSRQQSLFDNPIPHLVDRYTISAQTFPSTPCKLHMSSSGNGKKALPQRSTRGTRRTQLVGEAVEADEEFWNQDAFHEDESDEEFTDTTPDSDSSDSDIDEPEPNEDAEKLEKQRDEQRQAQAEKLAEAYTQTAASEAYTDPALQKKSTKALRQHVEKQRQKLKELTGQSETSKSSSSAAASESASASSTDHSQSASARHSKNSCAPTILDPDRALRTSTKRVRKYVESNQKEEEERDAKSVKSTAKQPKQPQLTQEDCLREAAETTIKNLRSLNAMQKMEEEAARKRKSGSSQRKLHGPRVVFHSSRGKGDLLVFTEVDEVPRIINSVCSAPTETPKSYFNPRQSAIYKDPLTGHGYRTKDEFKRLRSKFGKEGVKMMTPEARDRYEMRQNRQKRDHENKLLSKLSSLARQGENMGYVLDTHDRIGQSSR